MRKIAILTQNITTGAFQSVAANLTHAFSSNELFMIEVLYIKGEDNSIEKSIFSPGTNFIKLSSRRALTSVLPLALYLIKKKPDFLISMPSYINIIAIFAKLISAWKGKLIITEHATMSGECFSEHKGELIMGHMHILAKLFYKYADALVAVSEDILDDLKFNISISLPVMEHIPNPLNLQLIKKKGALIKKLHPWLDNDGLPCFISVGRLAKQKNYSLLLKAFCDVVKKSEAKLIIIGEGYQRKELTSLIQELNLKNSVELLGFKKNPFPYIKKADGFVLSSKEEGFGLVLVESMIIGTPVISTNAIGGGPYSILQNSKYGYLVNNQSSKELTKAILSLINNEAKRTEFQKKGEARALRYEPAKIGIEWNQLFKKIM